MKDLKFNIYGMARPTTPAELLALMKEFNSEAHILQETLEAIGDACEADVGPSIAKHAAKKDTP